MATCQRPSGGCDAEYDDQHDRPDGRAPTSGAPGDSTPFVSPPLPAGSRAEVAAGPPSTWHFPSVGAEIVTEAASSVVSVTLTERREALAGGGVGNVPSSGWSRWSPTWW